jgi:TRAP-type C4-dicarboxylate transport system substrate-binding protein
MKRSWLALMSALAMTTGTTSVSAVDKNINLRLSYWVPPVHKLTPGYKEWAESLKKATNGTITVTLFPSSQLGSGPDHYDMVKRGVADMGLINPGYTPGRFPVLATSDLPFLISDGVRAAPALTRWYRKYAAKEMPEHYVCHIFTHEPGTFHSTKEIKVPGDVKGLNIRTANQTTATYVTSMGGNSVQVPIMEAYETLKRGITDGITVPWGGLITFKFGTVTKYTLDTALYVSTFTHGISRKTFDSMSPAQQKAIDEHCTPEWSAKIYRFWHEQEYDLRAKIRQTDRVFTKIGPAEIAEWRKAAEPVKASWREAVAKAGYNPGEVLGELEAELKKADAAF